MDNMGRNGGTSGTMIIVTNIVYIHNDESLYKYIYISHYYHVVNLFVPTTLRHHRIGEFRCGSSSVRNPDIQIKETCDETRDVLIVQNNC